MTMRLSSLVTLLLFVSAVPLMAQETKEIKNTRDTQSQNQTLEKQGKTAKATQVQNEFELDEIVVTAARRHATIEKIENLATTATEITSLDIEERSDKVLKDVLYQVPGIQVSLQRKGTTQFYMRGYDMSKIAILVDDIPLIESYSGSLDIDNIGLMDISQIIVSRGTTSALYGTRGAVGSINLIRKEPTKMYTNLSAEYGQYGNIVTSISHGAPVGNFYYFLSAMHDKSNGYEISNKLDRSKREDWLLTLSRYDLYGYTLDSIYSHPSASSATYYLNDDTGLWDHVSHDKYKFNTKVGYHINSDLEAGVTSFYNHTHMKNSNYYTDMRSMYTYNGYTYEKDWRAPLVSYLLRNQSSIWPKYIDYAVSPYLKYEKGKFSINANAYFYENTNNFVAYDDPMEKVLAFNRDVPTMTWTIWTSKTYGLNVYPSYDLSPSNRLNFALSYYVSSHIEDEQAYNDLATDVITAYGKGKYKTMDIGASYLTIAVEDDLKIIKDLDLTLGVSFDGMDFTKYQLKSGLTGSTELIDQVRPKDDSSLWGTSDSFNPVADLIYEPIKDRLKLKAAASQKTSFPSLQAYSHTKSYYPTSADPNSVDVKLKPEKMFNTNVGFELSFFDKKLTWGTDYFYSKYNDKIFRIYLTRLDDYIYRNIDAASMQGIETTLNLNLPDLFNVVDVTASSTYTYLDAKNLTNVDDSFINKGEKLERLPQHKFTFDLRTHFKTDTSLIIFGNLEFNQIQYVMSSIPKNTADFSTSYFYAQKLHDPLKIDVKLSQKFLNSYEAYIMCKNILDDYNADPFNPGPGRMLYAGIKASF
jgi:outer membrane cobalamin receptor